MVSQFLLYNKVNQLYVYIYPHIPSLLHLPLTLPIPPLQVDTKHRADLPVLCSCFPLAICFTFGSVYMAMPLAHFIPDYLSPSPCPPSPFSSRSASLLPSCPQVLHDHIYIYIYIYIFFFFTRFHIYALIYRICFSLSDLLHSI